MKLNFSAGNLLIYGSILTLLFIFTLIFSFMKEELFLVTKNYYEEEVTYDQQKQELKNANLYGDQIRAEKNGSNVLLFIPVDISNNLVQGKVTAYFPSQPTNDQVFTFAKNDTGRYQFDINNSKNIPFTLKVKFADSEKSYYKLFQM